MSNLNLDLEKIQSVVASEASRAVTANNKRIIALVKQFAKDLIDAINEGAEAEAEDAAAKPAAKKPAKEEKPAKKAKEDKPAKPAKEEKPAKKAKEPEPEEDDEEEGDSVWDLLDEVTDEEIESSDYMKMSEAKLKKELKERGIDYIPDDAEKPDLVAALILIDEDEEGEEEE